MSRKLKIVADAHIWGVESAFSELGTFNVQLEVMENRHINSETVKHCDILLTRSSTKVDADLLHGSHVKFVATATIGDDHYDKQWLDHHGIIWANAAGSSTRSVIEYMITSFLYLHHQGDICIPETTIGIIGAGRIGSALATVCESMGMNILLNDPPRARHESDKQFCSLDKLLAQSDVISLHTPMIRTGEDTTYHLIDSKRLRQFQGFGIFNAARGDCIDNHALLDWLNRQSHHFAALDCWEFEPSPLQELFTHTQMALATPHIAGHSLDGKAANTLYIYRALCNYLQITPNWSPEASLPASPETVSIDNSDDYWKVLYQAANTLYPLPDDHDSMRSWGELTQSELPNAFRGYRRHYPERRAWECCPLHFDTTDDTLMQLAQAFGMKIV